MKNFLLVVLLGTTFLNHSILKSQNSKTFNNNFIGDGLTGYYYQGYFIDSLGVINCDSLTLAFSRTDTIIDFWNGSQYYAFQPVLGWANYYSVEWKGYIFIEDSGEYGFGTISDDGSQIFIDSILIVDNSELQWYDWEDNISEGDTSGTPFPPLVLDLGFHEISVRFYENASYDGIELWWLKPGADSSDIPYYGTNFHGIPPTYNPNTNWEIVPKHVLFSSDSLTGVGITINNKNLPYAFKVLQNYPNPFNNTTVFEIEIYEKGNLDLQIFDITGEKIFEDNLGTVSPITQKIRWNGLSNTGNQVSGGIYLYRFSFVGNDGVKNMQSGKMMFLK